MKINNYDSNELILKECAARIRDIRSYQNLKQQDLADKAGVSLSSVVRIEKGENVCIANILSVLRALGLMPGLESLLPPVELAPTELIKMPKKKLRVRHKSKVSSDTAWHWGDEK